MHTNVYIILQDFAGKENWDAESDDDDVSVCVCVCVLHIALIGFLHNVLVLVGEGCLG